ncbi:CCR4-NOT regulatory complex component [Entomophthora muscae]|uniref:CCR4-NOT regulatory complex component n=1 Tax=Entomophthora muscae TaxID=34485 RepID=A0ACC2RFG3_9FUNG|nr:CCR4-NOT regulatory complex component [Entomophthora muscae]
MPRIDTSNDSYKSLPTTHEDLRPDHYAIQVMKLDFDFGGPKILSDVSINVPKGARCLLVGANGAGKSTLLRVLAGKRMIKGDAFVLGKRAFLDRPGGVTYLGTEWVANSATKLDIQVGHLIESVGGSRCSERRDELLRILDVDPNWHMHAVSDGERRRVQMILGLMQEWQVLLLDEVTVDLDVLVRASLFKFLQRETDERGATIVYATHIFDGLGGWPTHLAHLHRGTILSVNQILPTPDPKPVDILQARLAEFPELLDAIKHTQSQVASGEVSDSPLLKVVEKWLQRDFLARLQAGDTRAHLGPGEGASAAPTLWDSLSEDIDRYGDKYYNYWK